MRQDERHGAWTLMCLIIFFGLMLWIFGKCRNGEDNLKSKGTEISILSIDSASNHPVKEEGIKKLGRKKGERGRKKINSRERPPVRDILADTIAEAAWTEM